MTLGSPSSPSAANTSNYLPSYLMGEPNNMTAPRTNTLSPTKGRTLAFAASSPTSPVCAPNDFNRSIIQQRSLFGSNNQTTPPHHNYSNAPPMSHNAATSGPPTQSLFDSLRVEQNSVVDNSYSSKHTMGQRQPNQSFAMNQSVCDSYLNQSNFNVSRITSPLDQSYDFRNSSMSVNCLSPPAARPTKHWITVYGFSPAATSMILTHFSQCGTILEKVFPPQSGNWVHLRFASSLECEKALNYHERILANSLMIGVTYCKDPAIVDKENADRNNITINRARPLAQVSYKTAQSATDITGTPTTPIRSSGIVNKAIDLFFGW